VACLRWLDPYLSPKRSWALVVSPTGARSWRATGAAWALVRVDRQGETAAAAQVLTERFNGHRAGRRSALVSSLQES
jgi:hypothetical protein